jgi:hypothetical protein
VTEIGFESCGCYALLIQPIHYSFIDFTLPQKQKWRNSWRLKLIISAASCWRRSAAFAAPRSFGETKASLFICQITAEAALVCARLPK